MASASLAEPRGVDEPKEAGPPSRPGLEPGLGFRLGRAHRMLRAAWEEVISDLGLSPPQAALLRAAAQRPGCGLRELARQMHTDPMNAKRLADHLERAGLVASVSDPGHRQRRVLRPTERGAAVAAELARRAAAHQRRLAILIGPAELAQLQGLLNHLESALAPSVHHPLGQGTKTWHPSEERKE
ncbi:MAG TPA: MarR family winged helix-turn-helix transcriptional regulator [Streptosporangiaceae bacterium]|nr:MarR family winged helix-turn-helix transcriptional regulator [Streptosporangiaceae bacterium]